MADRPVLSEHQPTVPERRVAEHHVPEQRVPEDPVSEHRVPVAIRPMRAEDLDQVQAIDAATNPRAWSRSLLVEELGRTDRSYLVAVVSAPEERVVGFGGLAVLAGEGHVMALAADPAWQRRGIGSQLLAALVDDALAAGCDAVTLEVRASNAAARRCYATAGFASAGRRPRYYPDGEDALILWLHRDRPASANPVPTSTAVAREETTVADPLPAAAARPGTCTPTST